MSHITFETAKSLAEAGFPQPAVEIGQFWYAQAEYKGGELEHNPLCVVVESWSERKPFLRRLTCERLTSEFGGQPLYFAPTATDILRGIQEDCNLSIINGTFYCEKRYFGKVFSHENPAEAAALAYLSSKGSQ